MDDVGIEGTILASIEWDAAVPVSAIVDFTQLDREIVERALDRLARKNMVRALGDHRWKKRPVR